MIRLFFSAGCARIVVVQHNSSTTGKSMAGAMEASAMYADPAEPGLDAIRGLPELLADWRTQISAD